MKRFIFVIAIIFAVSGCGITDSEESSGYPMQIGTWELQSEIFGEWQGVEDLSKPISPNVAQTDTIVITDTTGHSLTIEKSDSEGFAVLGFHDNTVSADMNDPDEREKWSNWVVIPPEPNEPHDLRTHPIRVSGYYRSLSPDGLILEQNISYACGGGGFTFPTNTTIQVIFSDTTGTPFRHYEIISDGFVGTLNHIICN